MLVATTKIIGIQLIIGGADIKAFHLSFGLLTNGCIVHQQARLIFSGMVITEGHIFPGFEIHNQTGMLAIFWDMGDAGRTPRLPV